MDKLILQELETSVPMQPRYYLYLELCPVTDAPKVPKIEKTELLKISIPYDDLDSNYKELIGYLKDNQRLHDVPLGQLMALQDIEQATQKGYLTIEDTIQPKEPKEPKEAHEPVPTARQAYERYTKNQSVKVQALLKDSELARQLRMAYGETDHILTKRIIPLTRHFQPDSDDKYVRQLQALDYLGYEVNLRQQGKSRVYSLFEFLGTLFDPDEGSAEINVSISIDWKNPK